MTLTDSASPIPTHYYNEITEAFTIRSDSGKVKQLDMLASAKWTGRAVICSTKLSISCLELHTWQIDRAIEGIEAADEGHFASDAENERILPCNCANSYCRADQYGLSRPARALESIQDHIAKHNCRAAREVARRV